MNEIGIYILVLIGSECALALLFAAIAQIFYKELGIDFPSILKGIIERAFLSISLINDYPHALTLFSALKLGTRLKRPDLPGDNNNKYNDFYLIGNLISVSFSILYAHIYKSMFCA